MPTQRFLRLSEEKQQIICKAIRQEFIRTPYNLISINQIIKNAGISRGSFYTYFIDKEDAVAHVMQEDYAMMKRLCKQALRQMDGDILEMYYLIFEFLAEKWWSNDLQIEIIKNLFFDSVNAKKGSENISGQKRFADLLYCMEETELTDMINLDILRIKKHEDIRIIMNMGSCILYQSLAEYERKPTRLDEIRNRLRLQIEILKYGAYC